MKRIVFVSLIFVIHGAFAQPRSENLIIITLDGFRWQEVFMGADAKLLFNERYTSNDFVRTAFWDSTGFRRRERLLPFTWNVIGRQGQLYGNRLLNNRVNCANRHWFSYPGYSEMFTGIADKKIKSNDAIVNPNYTFLEFINNQEGYRGKVASFSTWEVIPFIIRADQSGIFSKCKNDWKSQPDKLRDSMANSLDSLFGESMGVDDDFTTFYSAFEYLRNEKPKVLYISLDKTDEHAHGGDYDKYLRSAHATDRMIGELWSWVQSNENYRDKTTLLMTTDHGRGKRPQRWKKHGRLVSGSGQLWFAVIGPDTPAHGEIGFRSQYYQKQFAKTAASFLGLDFKNVRDVGQRIYGMSVLDHVAIRN